MGSGLEQWEEEEEEGAAPFLREQGLGLVAWPNLHHLFPRRGEPLEVVQASEGQCQLHLAHRDPCREMLLPLDMQACLLLELQCRPPLPLSPSL
jgi:hypothetical protein